jgi:hypothetical protein
MTILNVRTGVGAAQTSPKSTAKAYLLSSELADATCCNLGDLVQPHFFCGQLLTDQDLTTLLRWAQDKFRLNRYRDGWGVVCGLSVHCDPKRDNHVIVTPGYALDCCGDDIVVSQETAVDLSEACRKGSDPCSELTGGEAGEGTTASPESFTMLGLSAPQGELRTVDLFIRYREVQSDPQTALGRSVCKEVARCEYARTKEAFAFALECQPGLVQTDPTKATTKHWKKGYDSCSEALSTYLNKRDNEELPDSEAQKNWLLGWINNHPPQHFCFIRDWLCDPERDELTEHDIAAVLFLLVQDCRITYLSRECHDCLGNAGVPLARIWLNLTEESGKPHCQVLHIDPYPPYRRLLSRVTLPAYMGCVNLGGLIWRRWPEARNTLAQQGIRVAEPPEEPDDLPDTPAALQDWLSNARSLIVPSGSEVEVKVLEVQGEERVIGFVGEPCETPTLDEEESPPPDQPEESELAKVDVEEVDGIGSVRAEKLRAGGISTIQDLIIATDERIAKELRVSTKLAGELKTSARKELDSR